MKKNIALFILSALLLWTTVSLIRVENQRYAMMVGMCRDKTGGWNYKCLSQVETRTGWWWHLYYGLGG